MKNIESSEDVGKPAPPIKAAFHTYESPFLQLIAPIIATRYLWLAIEDINPRNFLGKPNPAERIDFKPFQKPSTLKYLSRNFAALGMGATFMGILGLYSKNTLHDIKSLYSEAVGYELNKKPEDVTLNDIFLKSKNAAAKVTASAYIKRTLLRGATVGTFFLPWEKFRDFKEAAPKYDANANAGVGAIGVYLLSESLFRKRSFFDAEQAMVNTSIHHNSSNPSQMIGPDDIKQLLELQRQHLDKTYEWPIPASRAGKEQLELSTRVASLMNQTYLNEPNIEGADFTIGKFNFLLGFGLLDKFPESMGFVELANKSSDMQKVKQAAIAIKNGQGAEAVFASLGVEMNFTHRKTESAPPAIEEKKFTEMVKQTTGRFTVPKSHQEFAAQISTSQEAGL